MCLLTRRERRRDPSPSRGRPRRHARCCRCSWEARLQDRAGAGGSAGGGRRQQGRRAGRLPVLLRGGVADGGAAGDQGQQLKDIGDCRQAARAPRLHSLAAHDAGSQLFQAFKDECARVFQQHQADLRGRGAPRQLRTKPVEYPGVDSKAKNTGRAGSVYARRIFQQHTFRLTETYPAGSSTADFEKSAVRR
jgi:hypothetical protein